MRLSKSAASGCRRGEAILGEAGCSNCAEGGGTEGVGSSPRATASSTASHQPSAPYAPPNGSAADGVTLRSILRAWKALTGRRPLGRSALDLCVPRKSCAAAMRGELLAPRPVMDDVQHPTV